MIELMVGNVMYALAFVCDCTPAPIADIGAGVGGPSGEAKPEEMPAMLSPAAMRAMRLVFMLLSICCRDL